jgi:hypothetical protein
LCVGLPLAEAMGQTLKHAGVAVTITSCTDVFAFAIGAVTVIHTDKKERKNFLIYREMRKGFLIYEEIHKYFHHI